jgi:hypothetical protein
LCQQRFSPQCDESFRVQMPRMNGPQAHRLSYRASNQTNAASTITATIHQKG